MTLNPDEKRFADREKAARVAAQILDLLAAWNRPISERELIAGLICLGDGMLRSRVLDGNIGRGIGGRGVGRIVEALALLRESASIVEDDSGLSLCGFATLRETSSPVCGNLCESVSGISSLRPDAMESVQAADVIIAANADLIRGSFAARAVAVKFQMMRAAAAASEASDRSDKPEIES